MSSAPGLKADAALDPAAGSSLTRVLLGARAAFSGPAFALRHPRLLAWIVACMVVYVGIWLLWIALASSFQDQLIDPLLPTRGASAVASALWHLLHGLLFVLYWVVALVAAFAVASPLMAPMLAMVAEVCEIAFYQTDPVPVPAGRRVREAIHGVGRAMVLSLVQVGGAAFIWLLGAAVGLVFPPAGTVIGLVFGGSWSSMWLAMMLMSPALENQFVHLGGQLGMPTRHTATLLGFGAVAQLLIWLPFAMPVLVVSASLLVFRLQANGHLVMALRSKALADAPR